MKRFIVKAFLLSAAAAALWWATAPWTRATTISLAKALHALVGYPAPYLLADLDDYYWFAPLFPPLAGLVLASHWVTLRRRLAGLAIGLAAFAYLVALQIAVVYSPYLTLSAARAYVMSSQIALNTVVVPVILWLIATAGPPENWTAGATPSPPADAPGVRPQRRPGLPAVAAYALLFCGVMTLPIPWLAARTTPTLTAARKAVARAVATGRPASAIKAIDTLFTTQQNNAALSYLQMQLYRTVGDDGAAERVMPLALTSPRRRQAFRVRYP